MRWYRTGSKKNCQSMHRAANEQNQGLRTTHPRPLECRKWTVNDNYQAFKKYSHQIKRSRRKLLQLHIPGEKLDRLPKRRYHMRLPQHVQCGPCSQPHDMS